MDRTVQHAFDPQEIMAYLDGELEPQRAAALAGHLVDCAECQQVARNFRSVSERLLDFEIEPTPQRLSSAALEAMNSGNYSPKTIRAGNLYKGLSRWRSLFAKRYVLGFAGALAVVALLIVAIPKMFEPKVAPNRIVALSRSDSVASVFREEAAEQKERNGVPEPAPPPVGDVVGQAGGVAGGVVQPGGELQAPETVGPMIVQTASLSIVAKNYDEANGAIERLASQRGGYVEKLEARAQIGNARALSASFRIPAKQLDAFLADLRKLGHVEQDSLSNEEVSAQYVDLQARLRSAQATEKRLIELLGIRTGKLSDVLDAERELARIRGEIESMQAQNTVLVHRVNYATVQVELSEEYLEHLGATSNGTKIWNALVEGFGNWEAGAVAGLTFLLTYGPSIIFWLAIILIPSWLVWKRYRQHGVQS